MTLLFIDGFDHYDPGDDAEMGKKWDATHVGHITATGRSGAGNSLSIQGTTQGAAVKTFAQETTIICGFAMKLTVSPTAQLAFFRINGTTGHPNNAAVFYINPSNQIVAANASSVVVGTVTTALTINAWTYIEIKVLSHQTAGTIDIQVDGVNVLSLTSQDTAFATTAGITSCGWTTLNGAFFPFHIDDVYICSDAGSVNNDFLGDVLVATVYPDGDSANDWTATGVGTTNADRVDENPADDDTTYVASSTITDQERYDYAAIPATVDTIHGVQTVPRLRKVDAGGTRTVRSLAFSVATETTGTATGVSTTYVYYPQVFEQDPDAVAAWTPTTLNAAKFGFEIVA